MTSPACHPNIATGNHKGYMEYALEKARLSPPSSTKFCVGAVLVDADRNEILSTGYSMELPGGRPGDPGNTHAEQYELDTVLPKNTILYTTMEPCSKRLSGNRTCTDRILALASRIRVVYVGIKEPGVFIAENIGRGILEDAGVQVKFVEGTEHRIFEVAIAGHKD
ncbi:DRAP deaminase [Aspergillus novoparasiticus]|uniref:DRAP deaminase n=1 Tax=Aspergillus novoparasiticus TaxID=986946 RepID=A0A5N6EBT8_9EURO|nr:DRAP deaminase [Aspergillus novoparasiticus]